MRKRPLAALGLALWCACTGLQGNGSLVGTIDGASFPIVDVLSATASGNGASVGIIAMSTKRDLCSRIAENTVDSNEHFVFIEVADVDPATQTGIAPTSTGLYPIAPGSAAGPAANVSVIIDGSDCTGPQEEAATGLVTISYANASGGVYNGSFDVVMGGSGDEHVTGTFSPENCPELAVLETGGLTGSQTCQ